MKHNEHESADAENVDNNDDENVVLGRPWSLEIVDERRVLEQETRMKIMPAVALGMFIIQFMYVAYAMITNNAELLSQIWSATQVSTALILGWLVGSYEKP